METRTRLAAAREAAGMTQMQVVRALKSRGYACSRPYYSLIELGLRDPEEDLGKAIADVVRAPFDSLFVRSAATVRCKALPADDAAALDSA